MANQVYCKYCGMSYSDARSLLNNWCQKNPEGKKHALYEGSEKAGYTCKYCGQTYRTIRDLTINRCRQHPRGAGSYHEPAL